MGIKKDAMEYTQKVGEAKATFWKKYWWLGVIVILAFIGIYTIMYIQQ